MKQLSSLKKVYFIYFVIFIGYLIVMPKTGHQWDMSFWEKWSIAILNDGISQIYFSNTNYLPLFHYILWLFANIQGSAQSIHDHIYFLKGITLIFDFISGFFLVKLISERFLDDNLIFKKSLFYFLNFCILYNTIIWGQIDSVMACFVFVAFYFAYKNKVLPSLIFYLLAINTKLQAIIFFPFIGLMLLPEIISHTNFKNIVRWVIIPVFVQILLLLPFIFSHSINRIFDILFHSVGHYPVVSMNAFNMWRYFLDGSLVDMPDNLTVMGLTYNKLGLLLFSITSFVALFPLLKQVFKSIKTKSSLEIPIEKLLIIGGLLPLLFFFVNTQMHERYSHPAFIFIITYSILENKYFIGIIASLAYFLNMECVLRFFQLPYYASIMFSQKFIATLYLLTIVLLFINLYENKISGKTLNK